MDQRNNYSLFQPINLKPRLRSHDKVMKLCIYFFQTLIHQVHGTFSGSQISFRMADITLEMS